MRYNTLNEALEDIANRSFYEGAVIIPENGAYHVENDSNPGEDSVTWSEGTGMDLPENVLDNSRVHENFEYYSTATHLRFNLEGAVEALENGETVAFHYVFVDDVAGDFEDDPTVGWALLAYQY